MPNLNRKKSSENLEESIIEAVKKNNVSFLKQRFNAKPGSLDLNGMLDKNQTPLLHLAIANNAAKSAKFLLSHNVTIDSKNSDNETAVDLVQDKPELKKIFDKAIDENKSRLFSAVREGNFEKLEKALQVYGSNLLDVGNEVSSKKDITFKHHKVTDKHYFNTLFHLAAKLGNTDIFNRLLQALDQISDEEISKKLGKGNTPLHVAAYYGHIDIVNSILASPKGKIWINSENSAGMTPLHASAAYKIPTKAFDPEHKLYQEKLQSRNETIIQILLDNGADPKAKTTKNYTVLHLLALTGRRDVKLMDPILKKMTYEDINAQNKNGDTALHLAIKHKNPSTLNKLMAWDADITLKNVKGLDAIDLTKKVISDTNWKRALIEGGIGEAACPTEATTSLVEAGLGFMKDHLSLTITNVTASVVTAGIFIPIAFATFFIAGYKSKRLNYGKEAQDNAALQLETKALQNYETRITRFDKSFAELDEKALNINQRIEQAFQEEKVDNNTLLELNSEMIKTRKKVQYLKKQYQTNIKDLNDKLPKLKDEEVKLQAIELPTSNSDAGKIPSLQRKFASSSAKKISILGGLGNSLGVGSALFSTALVIAKIALGAIALTNPVGLGIVGGIVLISAAVGYITYRETKFEFGQKRQKTKELIAPKAKLLDVIKSKLTDTKREENLQDLSKSLEQNNEKLKDLNVIYGQKFSEENNNLISSPIQEKIVKQAWEKIGCNKHNPAQSSECSEQTKALLELYRNKTLEPGALYNAATSQEISKPVAHNQMGVKI